MYTTNQYGSPAILSVDGSCQILTRRQLEASGTGDYDENWLQTLLFEHAEMLPIDQIDHAYEGLVPICRELSTRSGPLDLLYATPEGRLVVVEAKLWRNPEARRKVIAQILDYATELSSWIYEDLQREVSRSTKRTGNALYEIVRARYPEVQEARFVDDVSQCLRMGKFLLLIVGDGIREGTASIANFLERGGNLHFSLGLVEVAIFDLPSGRRLVQPRVLARTLQIQRTVLVMADSRVVVDPDPEREDPIEDAEPGQDVDPKKPICIEFWGEYLDKLHLDDQTQLIPKNGTMMENRQFGVLSKWRGWIAAFIGPWGGNEAGVRVTFQKGDYGDSAYRFLLQERSMIEDELGFKPEWSSKGGRHRIEVKRKYDDVLDRAQWPTIHVYLWDMTNRFVNTFRHRLVAWEKAQSESD